MNIQITIDANSGFCFGVTTAIRKAEEEVVGGRLLYSLGDIVHNGMECERLRQMGMQTIDHTQLASLHNSKVLFRAHGEPPETYALARKNHIEIIDATCPVVLQLQKKIKSEYDKSENSQIVIFGKRGHAEVLGLVGQTEGNAIVLEEPEDVTQLDFTRDIRLFSQTTKSLQEFQYIATYISQHILPPATFQAFDTVCRQVANRMPRLLQFCQSHDAILFVCGQKSSNGRILYRACQAANKRSFSVESARDIDFRWFDGIATLGICGATSTPKWLMEACRDAILQH